MAEAVLRTERLSKHFGGLAAVSDVSLEFFTDQMHAVIGPNGAGKTTLINLLSGDLPCTSGRIYLDGEDIAGLSADRISRRGVGRSYQKTNIFLPFTVFENCRLAAQSRLRSSMRFCPAGAGLPRCGARGRACAGRGRAGAPGASRPPRCRTASSASSRSP